MDSEAVRLTIELCNHLRKQSSCYSNEEEDLITEGLVFRLRHVEVFTQYHARTTTQEGHRRNMLPGEAECVEYFFDLTCGEIERSLEFNEGPVHAVQRNWMSAFSETAKEMPGRPRPAESDETETED